MIKKKVWRFYCEHCKKSNCSGGSISKHEKHCTMNPNRVCRMCKFTGEQQADIEVLKSILPDPNGFSWENEYGGVEYHVEYYRAANEAFEKLSEAAGNCPACILAAIRQKGIHVTVFSEFNFSNAVREFWSECNSDKMDHDSY